MKMSDQEPCDAFPALVAALGEGPERAREMVGMLGDPDPERWVPAAMGSRGLRHLFGVVTLDGVPCWRYLYTETLGGEVVPRVPTFREYLEFPILEWDRRDYGGPRGTFIWMGVVAPRGFVTPRGDGDMGDPYETSEGKGVPRAYLLTWQAGCYRRHYPDAPQAELDAAEAFVKSARTAVGPSTSVNG